MDKAVERLGLTFSTDPPPAPKAIDQIKNVLIGTALAVGFLYLISGTSFPIALLASLTGGLFYWREAYKNRVLPLVAAGMPRPEARVFTLMQLLWLGPLTIAVALFALSKYSVP